MHDTAAAFGAAFFRCYLDNIEQPRILDIGGADVKGSLRGCAPPTAQYIAIDLEAGPGVDLVLPDPSSYPFDADSFNAIVSSSCFEHDPAFWTTFVEMCRVLRSGGFIYVNAPSNGWFHRYPTDNWRFYPDAGLALAEWGRRNGHDMRLIESFIGRRRREIWNDCVLVFGKGETHPPLRLLADLFPRSFNIRIGRTQGFRNYCEQTEDMQLLGQRWRRRRRRMAETLKIVANASREPDDASIGGLIATLAEREVALAAKERDAADCMAKAEILRAEVAAKQAEIALLRDALAAARREM